MSNTLIFEGTYYWKFDRWMRKQTSNFSYTSSSSLCLLYLSVLYALSFMQFSLFVSLIINQKIITFQHRIQRIREHLWEIILKKVDSSLLIHHLKAATYAPLPQYFQCPIAAHKHLFGRFNLEQYLFSCLNTYAWLYSIHPSPQYLTSNIYCWNTHRL